jgi:Tol biopolymer transport system component
MWRGWAAAIVALAALLIVILVLDGSSPDAAGIAYVTGADASSSVVWLSGRDGSGARKLGRGTAPLLAPSGSLVAASLSSRRGPALAIYSTAGRSHTFFNAAVASATARAWSPDSRYLAVVLRSANPASDDASGLEVIDTSTFQATLVSPGSIYGASFAPDGTDRIVYGAARTSALAGHVNVHIAAASGSGTRQVSHGGRSLNPVWGRSGIAFDREQLRKDAAPAYQVWLMQPDGSGARPLTHEPAGPLLDGLVPLAFSADGTRLLAEYEGADTSQAWTIDVGDGSTHKLMVGGHSVTGGAISSDGQRLLVDLGGFLNPPDAGVVESIPFSGGGATVLIAHGSAPSWNL